MGNRANLLAIPPSWTGDGVNQSEEHLVSCFCHIPKVCTPTQANYALIVLSMLDLKQLSHLSARVLAQRLPRSLHTIPV